MLDSGGSLETQPPAQPDAPVSGSVALSDPGDIVVAEQIPAKIIPDGREEQRRQGHAPSAGVRRSKCGRVDHEPQRAAVTP